LHIWPRIPDLVTKDLPQKKNVSISLSAPPMLLTPNPASQNCVRNLVKAAMSNSPKQSSACSCSDLLQAPISIPADVRCMFQWRLFCRNASLRNSVASCETPAIPLIQTLSAPRRLSFKILICRPPNFSGCASASAIPCLMSSLCKKRFSKH